MVTTPLRKAREAAEMSRPELARLAMCSEKSLQNYETLGTAPKELLRRSIAAALGVAEERLFPPRRKGVHIVHR